MRTDTVKCEGRGAIVCVWGGGQPAHQSQLLSVQVEHKGKDACCEKEGQGCGPCSVHQQQQPTNAWQADLHRTTAIALRVLSA